jgi:tetratricopeptide (TPR) repeat protein
MDIYKELDALYAEGGNVEEFLRAQIAERESGAEIDKEETDAERIVLYNELGSFLRGVSRYDESATAFEKAAQLISEADGCVSLNYATTMNNLATTYRMMGDKANALKGYETSIAVYLGQPDTTPYFYAGVLNNLAALHLSDNNPAEAAELMEEAIVQLCTDPSLTDELATAKSNIASIYLALGDRDKANESLAESLEIFEAAGGRSAHYPAALNALAMLKTLGGEHEAAVEIWRKALANTSALFGENADFATSCRNMAYALANHGDAKSAKEYMAKYAEISERIFGADSEKAQTARKELAGLS